MSARNGHLHPAHGQPPLNGASASRTGEPPRLDVRTALEGKRLLVTGATGFLGKVTLSMLLHRYPEVGKIFVLVRPGTGGTAEARFFDKVAASRPFDPLRERYGAGFDAFLREKCVALAGDVTDPVLGLSEADLAALGKLDAVVNCAGLVDFNASLEHAMHVNVVGAREAAELCKRTGATIVHVSTCFVAGNRDGVVFEDEEIRGYFPRRTGVVGRPKEPTLEAGDFELGAELADCEKRIAQVREAAEDRVLLSRFRESAAERLRAEGRDAADEKALRLAAGREKRLWISRQLVELGMSRARHWGWPNTYTFTKSLGEQAIVASGARHAIVRPAIVESALRYPFPGWNEGFTTSAPLTFMALKGHRSFPGAEKAILEVVPVDLVAAAIIAVTARAVTPEPVAPPLRAVYHLASGDVNPLWVRRTIELSGLYRRRFFREREEGSPTWNKLLSRFEPYAVSKRHYETFSSPALSAVTRAASRFLREKAPRWGAPRLSALAGEVAAELDEIENQLEKTKALWDLYMPFVWENKYVFRCASVRELYERLAPRDLDLIPWDPEKLEWRAYWLDVHMKGMEEWVFPGLEEESKKKVHAVKAHRDLLELFEAACETHRRRVALRMTGERKERFTYGELHAWSERVARFLVAAGVKRGDRVLLASENRPEWAISFFGILRAGGVAVPLDAQLSAAEMVNLARTAGARIVILSESTAERVPELADLLGAAGLAVRLVPLAEALAGGPETPLARTVSPDDVASLIFTSGTTGTPKGVMLTHRNFASLVARLAQVFDLGPGDGMLSVLPLHHTFEFACGLLVPLSRGAAVEYLDELTSDTLSEALEEGRVTAMIGVPALWSLLHRRITQELAARPGFVEQAMRSLMKGNAALRDQASVNLGKLLFWPVHRKLGGRLRILVSGGSALAPEVQEAFHELGFDMYEGYGLTEASPVLAVSTPEQKGPRGSVGRALTGIELKIHEPDASGVGEVIARGPNVMLGYFKPGAGEPAADPDLTGGVVRDGWLFTGDLGKLDGDGNLTLVGRKKDVIIDATGKNVYPDEIEELYRDADLVKDLSVVGLPDGAGEKVAMLVVPEPRGRDRAELRRLLDAHVRKVSGSLAFHKRVKVWHTTDQDLPKTSTRKVKRRWVQEELSRLEAAAQKGRRARESGGARAGDGWLLDLVAEVSRKPRSEVTHQSQLAADLGFDSLMLTELAAALEEAGIPAGVADDLPKVQSVGELSRLVSAPTRRHGADTDALIVAPRSGAKAKGEVGSREIPVPAPLAVLGRRILSAGQRALYEKAYEAKVVGKAHVPRNRNFLVVANHSSHLDMGLVKVALGEQGERLAALAAADYFFDTPLKRAYFENFTNLIPMERSGSLKKSLRAALEALRRGHNLLIFPEGTRSRDGRISEFKATAGYLALHAGVDTLPVHIGGTFEALPPGAILPRRATLEVRIGAPIEVEHLRERTNALPRGDAYKAATSAMEDAVRKLAAGEMPRTDEPAPRKAPPVIASAAAPDGRPRTNGVNGVHHGHAPGHDRGGDPGADPLSLQGEGQGEGGRHE